MNSKTRSLLLVCSGTLGGFLTIGPSPAMIPDFVHDRLGDGMMVTGFGIGLQTLLGDHTAFLDIALLPRAGRRPLVAGA